MSTRIPHLSFEFFPPRTPEGKDKLLQVRDRLAAWRPDYFSVTYGAGGSTRDNTYNTVLQINADGHAVAPHLSFGADSADTIKALLQSYADAGVSRVVALRGDLPSGMGYHKPVYANELVAFIREHFGDHFRIMVAAYPEIHPQAESFDQDIHWLKEKFAAGADCALTQYFFNADAYLYFRDRCVAAGIDQPIVPGIMPITNYQSLVRFSDNCGADIPRWIRKRMESYGEDTASVKAFGIEVVSALCERLVEGGVDNFHFYTMNQYETTAAILENLGLQAG